MNSVFPIILLVAFVKIANGQSLELLLRPPLMAVVSQNHDSVYLYKQNMDDPTGFLLKGDTVFITRWRSYMVLLKL